MDDRTQRFTTTVVRDPRRRVLVPLPFDPDDAWGHKPHIAEIRAHALNAGYDRAMADHVHDGRDPPGSTTVRLKFVAPIKRGHGRCKRWAVH